METETTRAVTYSRNSSAEQQSIDGQIKANRAAAEGLGAVIVAELSDPRSASTYAKKARENWATLLNLLPTVDLIVLWEPSRGDRDLETWAGFLKACRRHSVKIHAVSHHRTYDPRIARDMRSLAEDGVDSQYESDKISEKTHRGLEASRAAGRPHGRLAYGYQRRYEERTGRMLEQVEDPATAAVVREIFAAVAIGESLHSLCARLTASGVPTPRGGRVWYASTVTGIIRNAAYRPHPDRPERGRRIHEGRMLDVPGAWPALVTETVWLAANRILGTDDEAVREERRDSAPGQIKYMLSGNVEVMSAPCGSLLTGWTGNGGRGAFYACRHDKCVSAPMGECDEYVTRLVVARMSRKDARRVWVADDAAAQQADEELARLREDLASNERDYRRGVISAKLAGARERELEPLIADAERRAKPAGVPLAALELLDAAEISESTVRPTWDRLPVTAKREIIAGLFASLVLGPITDRITRWTSPEERLAIVADRIEHEWRTA